MPMLKERGRALATLLGGLVSSVAGNARGADPSPPIDFEWHAPEGCADRDTALSDLIALLGNTRDDGHGAARPRVSVTLTPLENGHIQAEISMHGADGAAERSFEGASCARVTEAALLVVAMTYDPFGLAGELAPVTEANRGANAAKNRFSFGVRLASDVGSLPSATLAFGALVGLHRGPARLEAEGDLWLSRIARDGPHPESGGDIGLATGALRVCLDFWQIATTDLRLGPCVGLEFGVSSGMGLGLANPRTTRGLWSAALAGITLSQADRPGATPLRPWVSLEAGAAFVRPTFGIDGFGDVFSPSPIIGRASFGVAWMFP